MSLVEKVTCLPTELRYKILGYLPNPHGVTVSYLQKRLSKFDSASHCYKTYIHNRKNFKVVLSEWLKQWDDAKHVSICGFNETNLNYVGRDEYVYTLKHSKNQFDVNCCMGVCNPVEFMPSIIYTFEIKKK